MADLAVGDVAYTIVSKDVLAGSGKTRVVAKLVFGDSSLTVPSGGIPLSKGKLGLPNTIESLSVYAQGTSGYKFQYDYVNQKLVVMQAPAQTHAHDLLVKGGQAAATTNVTAHYATDILGKEAATDATIAGSASGTKGGVISSTLAAAALAQASAVAIAAQTIYVEAIGW